MAFLLLAQPAGAATTPSIAAGANHTCALLGDGSVRCWGNNEFGQLGNGTNAVGSTKGVAVQALSGTPTKLTAGWAHTCVLSTIGSAKAIQCWGSNSAGQLGIGSSVWGSNRPMTVTGLAGTPVDVAAGGSHTCAIVVAGAARSIQCWGMNDFGQIGNGSFVGSTIPVAVPTPGAVPTAITAGDAHTCSIVTSGATSSVKCWGDNGRGQLGTGSTTDSLTPVTVTKLEGTPVAISAGWRHTCAVTATGSARTARCWGANESGQLGNGNTRDSSSPTTVAGLSAAVISIAPGAAHTCALSGSGAARSVSCWGAGSLGQLAQEGTSSSLSPLPVRTPVAPAEVVSGRAHSCLLRDDATVKCWGASDFGQTASSDLSSCAVDGIQRVCVTHATTAIVDPALPLPPTIVNGPDALTRSRTATISFTLPPGATALCSTDGSTQVPCTSPVTLNGLGDGAHGFAIRSTSAGSATSPPSDIGWEVDGTPPSQPAIVTRPPERTNSTGATFELTVEPGAVLTCRLDGGPESGCGPKPTFSGLAEGSHELEVAQTDAAGNRGEATRATWIVDTVAPDPPTITSSPSAPSNSKTASFTVTVDEGSSLSCRLDLQEWGPCTSPVTFTNLRDGNHVAKFKQTDAAGNTGQFTIFNWTVDTVAPTAPAITRRPANPTNATAGEFQFGAQPVGVALTCTVDASAPTPCATGLKTEPLSDGPHTVLAEASDLAGNKATTTWNWTIDTVAPGLTGPITTTRSGRNLILTSRFDAPLGRPTLLEYSLSRTVPPTTSPNPRQVVPWSPRSTLANRTSAGWVRVRDAAGNWSRWYRVG